jgi:hypothetical protein
MQIPRATRGRQEPETPNIEAGEPLTDPFARHNQVLGAPDAEEGSGFPAISPDRASLPDTAVHGGSKSLEVLERETRVELATLSLGTRKKP